MSEATTFPEIDCHHVAPSSDNAFTQRMRFHQSWYRRCVLGLDPGPNPHARNSLYGNMLTESDGAAGRNFLTEEAHQTAKNRFPLSKSSTGTKDLGTSRLYHNMLSSQPLCFNLFGPLKHDQNLATELLRRLPGFPEDAEVTRIELEHAPSPKERFLSDATAFDAFVEYRRANGDNGFIGIETKLTEPFSQKEYAFSERYSRWTRYSGWWWKSGSDASFPKKAYNQIWRNHLLAFSVLRQEAPENRFQEGFCAVVYHSLDSHCSESLAKYREHLTPDGNAAILEWKLDDLVSAWANAELPAAERGWLDAFWTRYCDLERSEATWQQFRRSGRSNG